MNRQPSESDRSFVAQLAANRNAQTRELTTYGSHQLSIMRLIQRAAAAFGETPRPTLSVIGAGNCLDLNLAQLSALFSVVNLVDIDREAVELALKTFSQRLPGHSLPGHSAESVMAPFQIAAPIDFAWPLSELTPQAFETQNPEELVQQLMEPLSSGQIDRSDIIVSACLLSQIINALTELAGARHPQLVMLLQAVRRGHLFRMIQSLKPSGRGIFVSDLVSSDTLPELLSAPDERLPTLLAGSLSAGNFFSGLHPGVLIQDLKTCLPRDVGVEEIQMHAPWKWTMGPRSYAVYAITFRRL